MARRFRPTWSRSVPPPRSVRYSCGAGFEAACPARAGRLLCFPRAWERIWYFEAIAPDPEGTPVAALIGASLVPQGRDPKNVRRKQSAADERRVRRDKPAWDRE